MRPPPITTTSVVCGPDAGAAAPGGTGSAGDGCGFAGETLTTVGRAAEGDLPSARGCVVLCISGRCRAPVAGASRQLPPSPRPSAGEVAAEDTLQAGRASSGMSSAGPAAIPIAPNNRD